MTYLTCLAAMALTAVAANIFYRAVNRGLSSKARHQQLTRLSVGALIGFIPLLVAAPVNGSAAALVCVAVIAAAQAVTYPLLYFLTNRKVAPDIDNFMDIAVGEYLFGLLGAAAIITTSAGGAVAASAMTLIEIIPLAVIVFQWGYRLLYNSCFDSVGARVLRESHVNEVIEFVRSGSRLLPLLYLACAAAVTGGLFMINLHSAPIAADGLDPVRYIILAVYMAGVGYLTFNPRNGAVKRSGPVRLMLDEIDYARSNAEYLTHRDMRVKDLSVTLKGNRRDRRPQTVIMVIGESASRDYMSAFAPQPQGMMTTPWLSEMTDRDGDGFILFPNTYSCAFQTVPTLERALTEKNQYNDLEFKSSCSIIDIARAAGYRIHWYSNQGHLGSFDTPVTLVAETSDVAKWTNQQVGKLQYDSALIDFFEEIDPTVDNFIVFHLKGSHFNFFNRYPAEERVWGDPHNPSPVDSYRNSIRYTDSILRRIYDYARANLNLQAMVYFSDHATIPDRRRSPNFDGFGQCRIPLFVYLSDNYRAEHPERAAALKANRLRYVTNDLMYDLMCGILDIESPNYDPTQSLASMDYRFTPDMLMTYIGTRCIADDRSLAPEPADDVRDNQPG